MHGLCGDSLPTPYPTRNAITSDGSHRPSDSTVTTQVVGARGTGHNSCPPGFRISVIYSTPDAPTKRSYCMAMSRNSRGSCAHTIEPWVRRRDGSCSNSTQLCPTGRREAHIATVIGHRIGAKMINGRWAVTAENGARCCPCCTDWVLLRSYCLASRENGLRMVECFRTPLMSAESLLCSSQ